METNTTIQVYKSKIDKAAQVLSMEPKYLEDILTDEGMGLTELGYEILMSETTQESSLATLIRHKIEEDQKRKSSSFKIDFAVSVLKKETTQESSPKVVKESSQEVMTTLKQLFPVPLANRKDRDLLEEFISTEEISVQDELFRRANGNRFIILNSKKQIDVELSLRVLKAARKGTVIPNVYPLDSELVRVYHISEYSKDTKYLEESPIAPGKTLIEGWCLSYEEDFSNIGIKERQFIRMVLNYTGSVLYKNDPFKKFEISSLSDRKALLSAARAGLESLKKSWPSVAVLFEEAEELNKLPSLRILKSEASKIMDPFKVAPSTHKNY